MAAAAAKARLAALQSRLQGGHFRYLNEQLYTQTGASSLRMIAKSPELFTAYHEGFRAQVADWPVNPLDVIIDELRKTPGVSVADLGCGEARLAATLSATHSVRSFDLLCPPGNRYITVCNIAELPLPSNSVDVVVFCLSLMGTDFMSFLREGVRVCKPGGRLLIAEVQSRFQSDTHKASYATGDVAAGRKRSADAAAAPSVGVRTFVKAVTELGCAQEMLDADNPMFVLMYFRKHARAAAAAAAAVPAAATERAHGHTHTRADTHTHAVSHTHAVTYTHGRKKRREGKGSGRERDGAPRDAHVEEAHDAAAEPLLRACTYKKR